MEVTWYGTASLKLNYEETAVVFDPFKRRNPKLPVLETDHLADAEAILITHGHFDHIADVPEFSRQLDLPVYCPESIGRTLKQELNLEPDLVREFRVGESFTIGGFELKTFKGSHVTFDFRLILDTLRRIFSVGELVTNTRRIVDILRDHRKMPAGQCVNWLIRTPGTDVLHTGSLGLDEGENYPESVDHLSLAYQGSSRIDELALEFARQFQPESVLLHHFDDAFPPLTQEVPVESFRKRVRQNFPDVDVLKPNFDTPIRLKSEGSR